MCETIQDKVTRVMTSFMAIFFMIIVVCFGIVSVVTLINDNALFIPAFMGFMMTGALMVEFETERNQY